MQHLPETNEILKTGLTSGKPYLGTPSVVDGIIRDYLHQLAKLRHAQLMDNASLEDGLLKAATALQVTLYGGDSKYLPSTWNTERLLGRFLVDRCGIGGETADAVKRAAIHLASEFYDIIAHVEGGGDEAGAKRQVDELVATWYRVFTGRPHNSPMGQGESLQKSYVPGYTRGDGVFVKPHYTKVSKKAPQKPVYEHHHPKKGDKGERVGLKEPSQPSAPGTWHQAKATATFVPEGDFPQHIGGVPLKSWDQAPVTKKGWNYVPGINSSLREKPMVVPVGKHAGAGVIIEEADGRIWLVSPSNAFGGYKNTFPKGTCEEGLSMQANAIKEAWEEAGLAIEIVDVLGDFERTTSKARMYIARRTGGNPVDMGWESQAVQLVPPEKLRDVLNMDPDQVIVDAYMRRKKD